MNLYPDIKKIDIGCGNRPKEGFTTVDKFVDADIKADLLELPFFDKQIEEINLSHVLEHLSFKDTLSALKECYRVLKEGGSIYVEVPDFEWLIKDWLEARESDKWGHRNERIFGMQSHDGEYHKAGFTQDRLRYFLSEAGFKEISVVSTKVEFHDFVLQANAKK